MKENVDTNKVTLATLLCEHVCSINVAVDVCCMCINDVALRNWQLTCLYQ